jgi:serine/threonine protein kinase
MLIDANGHIKLTDFGLSRAGFLGRRAALGDGDALLTNSSGQFENLSGLPPHLANVGRRDSVASASSAESSKVRGRLTGKLIASKQRSLVGTPDYLAPESILGLGQGFSVDWVIF